MRKFIRSDVFSDVEKEIKKIVDANSVKTVKEFIGNKVVVPAISAIIGAVGITLANGINLSFNGVPMTMDDISMYAILLVLAIVVYFLFMEVAERFFKYRVVGAGKRVLKKNKDKWDEFEKHYFKKEVMVREYLPLRKYLEMFVVAILSLNGVGLGEQVASGNNSLAGAAILSAGFIIAILMVIALTMEMLFVEKEVISKMFNDFMYNVFKITREVEPEVSEVDYRLYSLGYRCIELTSTTAHYIMDTESGRNELMFVQDDGATDFMLTVNEEFISKSYIPKKFRQGIDFAAERLFLED